jgi:hypothetical protein
VEDAADDMFTDPYDVEDDGTASPSNAHGGEQTPDGQEAPDHACLPRNPPGVLNLGGDPPIKKEEIANIACLACNMPGADRDLARPTTEWGYTQLGSLLGAAQAAFDEDQVDYNTEEAIKTCFQSDDCNCNAVASDYILSRGLLGNPYLTVENTTGVQCSKWNMESRTRSKDHFALNTVIPRHPSSRWCRR